MKLKRINYSSALFFGVLMALFQLLVGLAIVATNKIRPEILVAVYGASYRYPGAVILLISSPIMFFISTYLTGLFSIWIYNFVAKKYPISWSVGK